MWAMCKTLLQFQIAKVKNYFNLDTERDSSKSRLPPGLRALPQFSQPGSQALPAPKDAKDPRDATLNPPELSASSSKPRRNSWLLTALPSLPEPGTEMKTASRAFKFTLAKEWKHPEVSFPRGAVAVSGLVELHGSRGSCTMQVLAAYHVENGEWLQVRADMKRILPKVQRPSG
jgi:hypothetical protein